MSCNAQAESALPRDLERWVARVWGLDVEPFEAVVATCFGQEVPIINEGGRWTHRINVEHVGYGTKRFEWGKAFHANPLMEWVYRSVVVERIQTHIDVRSVFGIANCLNDLALAPSEADIAPAVLEWASQLIAQARVDRRDHLIHGVRAVFQWAVESLLPGFYEADLDTLATAQKAKKAGVAVTTLDPYDGPFTASELARIERALHNRAEWRRERAMYYLCRDWGLRPIQLALLRQEDFSRDPAGPYILVPSVKGPRRSHLRRSPKNLKKRYLSDEAANAISDYLSHSLDAVIRAQQIVAKDNGVPMAQIEKLPIPLFPGKRPALRNRRFFASAALRPYTLHSDSGQLSREMVGWGARLALPGRYPDEGGGGTSTIMEISAYRFRRTKATAMVISGHSPEDVAEALDHMGTGSIEHYFRFNLDLIDFVNAAHNSSNEIKEAVAFWSCRLSSKTSKGLHKEMRVANLGICKAIAVCPHHPTVTCYSCPKFRPFKEADHGAALRAIEGLRGHVHEHGTGPVRHQVDAALAGVRAVIEAIRNERE